MAALLVNVKCYVLRGLLVMMVMVNNLLDYMSRVMVHGHGIVKMMIVIVEILIVMVRVVTNCLRDYNALILLFLMR